jgi:hypothetical protein
MKRVIMSHIKYGFTVLVVAFSLQLVGTAQVQAQGPSEQELAEANNPLADIRAFNLQNYYVPKLFGLENQTANTFWLRGVIPTGRVLWRASLPLQTVPPVGTGSSSSSGVGDFNIFAAYLAVQKPSLSFGVGPQLVAPTASKDELGAGKWQLGVASVVFAVPSPAFQTGALVTWQASVAGDSDRSDTSVIVAQVFSMWQLGGGTYLRSAPIWVFDLKTGNYNVPFGLGIGKVMKVDNTVFNIFIEPQFTILHEGIGQPALQIFTGLNMQFN